MLNILKFYFLIVRFIRIKFNDKFAILNYFGIPLVIGFLTSFVMKYSFDEYTLASNEKFKEYLFLIIVIAIFLGLTNSIREIVSFRTHFMKERRTGMSPALYYFSIFTVLATILGIQILILTLVGNLVLENTGSLYVFFIWPFLAGLGATVTGLFVSSLVTSETSAMIFIPLVLIPQIIFAGSLVSFDKMNKNIFISHMIDETKQTIIPEVSQIMISRWATEGYLVEAATQVDPQKTCLDIWFKKADELRAQRRAETLEHEVFVELIAKNELKQRECDKILSTINLDIENAVLDANNKEGEYNHFSAEKKYFMGNVYQTVNFNKLVILFYTFVLVFFSILSLRYDWWELLKNKLS